MGGVVVAPSRSRLAHLPCEQKIMYKPRPLRLSGSRRNWPWRCSRCFLEGIVYTVALSEPDLCPLLGDLMFHKCLPCVLGLEIPDEPWIPQFRCYAQIFTAAHHGVGFAAFGSGWYAVFREVVLFASGYRDESRRNQHLFHHLSSLVILTFHVRRVHTPW